MIRTLLVEDDATSRQLMEVALEHRGHAVAAWETAEEALEAAGRTPFDLAVVDLVLPEMDGLQLCRHLRAGFPWGRDVVIVVVTVKRGHRHLMEVLDAGADDYLAKPVDSESLDVRFSVAERRVESNRARRAAETARTRSLHRLAALREIHRSILTAEAAESIAAAALRHLSPLVPFDAAAVQSFDFLAQEAHELLLSERGLGLAARGSDADLDDYGVDFDFLQGRTRVAADLRLEAGSAVEEALAAAGLGAFVHIPLIARSALVGSVYLARSADRPFLADELEILGEVGESLAVALHDASLYDEVKRLSTTDELTGLASRRHLFDSGRMEFDRNRRYRHPMAVIMLDVDHFKRVNDSHGHAVGDEVLKGIAGRCRAGIRSIDILGRYGGEEFALVLPETDLKAGALVAERLRTAVAAEPLESTAGPIAVTVSCGVAEMTAETPTFESLLDAADRRLYRAKQDGRNCTRC